MDCIFCKIASKEMSANIIYEDDIVIAFLDAFPDSNGHTLIVPKKHTLDIDTIDDDTLIHIMMIAKQLKILLVDKLKCDGVTLIQNNGDVEEVKHFHIHLKPHYCHKQTIMKSTELLKLLKNS